MVDSALIDLIKKQDQRAFQKMYESCIRYVYAIVKRYLTNESDHQDVIQEIFARLFLSINSFDEGKGEFKFWLRRLTINQCIQHYHKSKESLTIVPIDSEARMKSSSDEHISVLSKEEIVIYLKAMPQGYKQIFMLVVIDDYSHQEVGEMLNISPETSRSQLHRAKKWLRANLSGRNLNMLASGL